MLFKIMTQEQTIGSRETAGKFRGNLSSLDYYMTSGIEKLMYSIAM